MRIPTKPAGGTDLSRPLFRREAGHRSDLKAARATPSRGSGWMIMIPMGKPKRPRVLAPCAYAGSRRTSRSGRHCAPRDRARHRRASKDRTRQAAVIVDGVVSHVTVTDPHHALSGQRLSLVSLHSARGPTFLVVELGDGRRRSIRRLVTDLGTPSSVSPPRASDLPRITRAPCSIGAPFDHDARLLRRGGDSRWPPPDRSRVVLRLQRS